MATPLLINFAVGKACLNKPDDVQKIITLLREVPEWAYGSPDANTENFKDRILKFQRGCGVGGGDGIVSPGITRPTLKLLNKYADRLPPEPDTSKPYPVSANTVTMLEIPAGSRYSQGDGRWGDQVLNDTPDEIRAKGCALTACATLISAKNIRFQDPHLATVRSVLSSKNPSYALDPAIVTPATLEAWMSHESQGYSGRRKKRSDLDFGYLTGGFGNRVWLYRQYKDSETNFAEVSRWLRAGSGIVAHLSNEGTSNHWVVLTGFDKTNVFSVMDRSCGTQLVYFDQLDRFTRYHFS